MFLYNHDAGWICTGNEGRLLEVIPTLGQQGITVSREVPINYINRVLQTQHSQFPLGKSLTCRIPKQNGKRQ